MTLAAWMIAQDMRRIERDAVHLVALRDANATERSARRAAAGGTFAERSIATFRRLSADRQQPVVPECCPA